MSKIKYPETLDEARELLQDLVRNAPYGKSLWDVLTCLRGPDSPSECGDGAGEENSRRYDARRERKARTVEVIRGKFIRAGEARYRTDRDWVELPPQSEWDHFDRHVVKAANALGLEIRIDPPRGVKVDVMEGTATGLGMEKLLKKLKKMKLSEVGKSIPTPQPGATLDEQIASLESEIEQKELDLGTPPTKEHLEDCSFCQNAVDEIEKLKGQLEYLKDQKEMIKTGGWGVTMPYLSWEEMKAKWLASGFSPSPAYIGQKVATAKAEKVGSGGALTLEKVLKQINQNEEDPVDIPF